MQQKEGIVVLRERSLGTQTISWVGVVKLHLWSQIPAKPQETEREEALPPQNDVLLPCLISFAVS